MWLVKRSDEQGTWFLHLSIGAKRPVMGPGHWPYVLIAEARERAAETQKTVRDGTDPITEHHKSKLGSHRLTVTEVIDGLLQGASGRTQT